MSNLIANNLKEVKNRLPTGKFKKYFMADSLISKVIFIIFISIMFVLSLRLATTIIGYIYGPKDSPYLIKGLHKGTEREIIQQNPKDGHSLPILRSRNKDGGIEFTYSVWLNMEKPVDSDVYHIFHKGSSNIISENNTGSPSDFYNGSYFPENSPGLYLDSRKDNENKTIKNDLIVYMSTFKNPASSGDESLLREYIVIPNIPYDKWVCVIIRLTGNKLDVYINGIIAKRHLLIGVPKQNYDNIYVCAGNKNGFNGNLSDLRYFDYSLNILEINSIATKGPNLKMYKKTSTDSAPPYLSTNWYLNN